mgnify:FL=1
MRARGLPPLETAPSTCELSKGWGLPAVACSGPPEVRVSDTTGASEWGCVLHAAITLRAVPGARVAGRSRNGAGIEAHNLALRAKELGRSEP